MMKGEDVLSSFYANICNYFSGKCVSGKCSLVKKHKEHLQTDGDFSITCNIKALQKHASTTASKNENTPHCQSHKSEELNSVPFESDLDIHKYGKVLQNLVEFSDSCPLKIAQSWPLKIGHHERLCLHLNRLSTFGTVLPCILSQGSLYGKFSSCHKKILLTANFVIEDEWMMNVTDYRRSLVRCVLKNLLTETGHLVILDSRSETSFDNDFHYHLSSKTTVTCPADVLIFCGGVIDIQKKLTERDVLAEDYLRQRCEELKVMSRHKHGPQVDNDVNWEKFFRKIGEASLRIDLLSTRPSRNVSLDFRNDTQETCRNAHFILYNCARLAALQEKFDKKCSDNVYPSLVPLEEIDFSLLTKEEEWELLSNYLLMYPHVLQSTMEFVDKGKPMPNLLCQFLSSLCGCYSSYYRRVRVLTESRDHMLPVMFARLYLLRAVECVLHNGLRLLGIEPVRYM